MESLENNGMTNPKKHSHKIFITAISASSLFLLYIAHLRVQASLIPAFDTGIYMQILSNLIHFGDISSSLTTEHNFFAHHFQPIVLVLLPFYYFWQSPMVFFIAALLSVHLSIWITYKCFHKRFQDDPTLFYIYLFAIFWWAGSIGRTYYNFMPEIFALPCFIYQGYLLLEDKICWKEKALPLALSLVIAGLCKENIWLINAFTCFLFALKFSKKRILFASISLISFAVFLGLFFYWMPKNTTMPSYYGLSYYLPWGATTTNAFAIVESMVKNLLSTQSLMSVFAIASCTGFLCLFNINYALIAALPGVFFILTSHDAMLHHIGNHYSLLYLGFLWCAGLYALKKSVLLKNIRLKYMLVILLLLFNTAFTFLSNNQILANIEEVQSHPHNMYIKDDLEKISKGINTDNSLILTQGSFVLNFIKQHKNIISFEMKKNNPTILTAEIYAKITDVVISKKEISNCDMTLQRPPIKNNFYQSKKNFEEHYRFCKWLKSSGMVFKKHPKSKILHYYYWR